MMAQGSSMLTYHFKLHTVQRARAPLAADKTNKVERAQDSNSTGP